MKFLKNSYIKVSKTHKIFYQIFGRNSGVPIIFLHGGPGGRAKTDYLDYLEENLNVKAILFDQRGSGESKPLGETKENTTLDLIEDIEKLRQHLKLPKIYLFGSSWGSTLALLYAEKYPQNTKGLFLKSIFLARKKDIDWVYSKNGAYKIFPDKYEDLLNFMKKKNLNWKEIIDYSDKTLKKGRVEEKRKIVKLLYGLESSIFRLDVPIGKLKKEDIDEKMIASAKIYFHYLASNFFLQENQILKNISKIKQIPAVILHGRYDMLCPLEGAYTLYKLLPKSQLFITNYAGHSIGWDGKMWLKEKIKTVLIDFKK